MERAHDTMMNPPIEDLLDEVDSKFGLVTLAARRARHINAYFNQLGEGLGHMVPPQVASISHYDAKYLAILRLALTAHDITYLGSPNPSTFVPAPDISRAQPPPRDASPRCNQTSAPAPA